MSGLFSLTCETFSDSFIFLYFEIKKKKPVVGGRNFNEFQSSPYVIVAFKVPSILFFSEKKA